MNVHKSPGLDEYSDTEWLVKILERTSLTKERIEHIRMCCELRRVLVAAGFGDWSAERLVEELRAVDQLPS